jgi:hypothetical protein
MSKTAFLKIGSYLILAGGLAFFLLCGFIFFMSTFFDFCANGLDEWTVHRKAISADGKWEVWLVSQKMRSAGMMRRYDSSWPEIILRRPPSRRVYRIARYNANSSNLKQELAATRMQFEKDGHLSLVVPRAYYEQAHKIRKMADLKITLEALP